MLKELFIIILIMFLIGNVMAYGLPKVYEDLSNSSLEDNTGYGIDTSCSGEICNTDYTYQDDLNDSKCWYNINFCNLGENSTLNYDIINILKQANYQMQDELKECNNKINNISYNKTTTIISLIAVVLMLIWTSYIVFKRKEQWMKQT